MHENKKNVYLVMQFVQGKNLLIIHSLGLLPVEEELRCVLKQCLIALKHLHDSGVVFRDLKPESVVLKNIGKPSASNHIKLVGYNNCLILD